MSSRFYSWLLSGAFAGMMFSLSGCGGGDTTVASAPPATTNPPPAATSTPAESSAPPATEQSSYAGEQKSTNAGGNAGGNRGGSSGGSSGGRGGDLAAGALMSEPESGGGDGYTPPGSGGPSSGPPGMAGGPGFSGGSSGGSSGGMPGADVGGGIGPRSRGPGGSGGMGMSGGPEMGMNSGGRGFGSGGEMLNEGGGSFGGGADTTQLVTFVRENCINCHSAGNPKGGVSLDQVGGDLKSNGKLWSEVADVLEGGSMPPRNARQPDASQKAAVIRLIRQMLDGKGGDGPAEKSFMDRAEMAFRKGDHEKAMSLFYAQLITADAKEVSDLANHFKLYKPTVPEAEKDKLAPANETAVAVKPKLVTGLKLAVGVVLKAGQGVNDVKPVGVPQLGGPGGGGGLSEGAGGPGSIGGRSGGGGGNLGPTKMEAFEDLTGDIGRQIVSSYDSRRASGKYGTLFSSLNEDSGPSFGAMGAGGFEQNSDMGDGGGLAGASMGGPGRGGGMAGGMPGGMGPGGGMAGGMGPGAGMGGGMGMGGASRPTKTMPGKSLANGLLYIGKAENQVALFKKAMEAGVDGLIIVDVDSSIKNRVSGIVSTKTSFRFMLPSFKVVATGGSKPIENTEVEMKQDTEVVQKRVDQLFNQIDTILNVGDIPQTISAASAMKQLHAKVHTSGADRLQIMAEARMFHAKGIISNDQLETVYQVVLEGNEGVALANGTADDKKLVMTSFTEKL